MTRLEELPELSIKTDRIGATPWDYRVFLCHGMSSVRKQSADKMLRNAAQVRGYRAARLPLVLALRENAEEKYGESPSHRTFVGNYQILRNMYAYCDAHNLDITAANAVDIFIAWSDDQRSKLEPKYHYSSASRLARMLSDVTEIDGDRFRIPARLIKPPREKNWTQSDIQNLEETYRFGGLMRLVSDHFTTDTITGPLPLQLCFGDKTLELWGGVPTESSLKSRHLSKGRPAEEWQPDAYRVKTLAAGTLSARRVLVNLRIEAELAIFIAQTGMNLAEAFDLCAGKFRYKTREGGYLVKGVFKDRRGGEVAFDIFKAYRPHFEKYLKWRNSVADAADERMFPFASRPCDPIRQEHHTNGLRRLCQMAEIAYVGARELRGTRVNYFLRRSDDPVLTASVAQHSVNTLMGYQRPHHQRAAREISGFWNDMASSSQSAGPGTCNGSLEPMPTRANQPAPDCRSAAGCLFCFDHRDEMSLDYAWSLVSYRHIKATELAAYPPTKNASSELTAPEIVIHALSEKLSHMRAQCDDGMKYVQEAEDRVLEGDFHPRWSALIDAVETYYDTPDL